MQVISARDGFILSIFNASEAILNAAEHYAELGYSVIPIYADADPDRAKIAAVAWTEFQQRIPTLAELLDWFAKQQFLGLAIVTGSISSLIVLDFDSESLFSDFSQQLPHLLQTYTIKTRRGCHLYFRLLPHLSISSRKGQGIDLQSEGRYVVAPPTHINGHVYQVIRGDEPHPLTEEDISRIQGFFEGVPTMTPDASQTPHLPASTPDFEPVPKDSRVTFSRFLTAGDPLTLYQYLAGQYGRNEALFEVSLQARDDGWTQEKTAVRFVDVHAKQPPCRSHHPETYEQRRREAISTIQSAYSRPAHPRHRKEGFNNTQLPNSVREKLLEMKQTYTIRVIESLRLAGIQPAQVFTTAQALELLRGQVGRDSIYHALAAKTPENLAVFTTISPSQHPQKPANADIDTLHRSPTKCRVGNAQKSGKSKSHRSARVFVMPGNLDLCHKLGVKLSLSDPLASEDLHSAKKTRQALHREFIKRRPGIYPRRWLARRLGVGIRTLQMYNHEIPIHSLPMYLDTPISWRSLAQIPDFEVEGTFLQDETSKKYPPRRDIALRLLRQRHFVTYRRREANYYYYGDSPPDMEVRLGLRPNHEAWEAKQAQMQTFVRQHEPQVWEHLETRRETLMKSSASQNGSRASAIRSPAPSPPVASSPTVASPRASTDGLTNSREAKQLPEKKRSYRKPFDDDRMERLAQQIHAQTNPDPSGNTNGMSLCNARRLVDTYGVGVVEKTMKRMLWLRERGKIQNAAGFLVIVSRVTWRLEHGATDLGSTAPRF
jgi:hypothetical protein